MSAFATLKAQIRRRLLVTYAIRPDAAAPLLPPPFRPQLVAGSAVGGFCMIGLNSVRPGWVGPALGVRTENAAHRIAVEWDENGETKSGVYIFERHSSSRFPVIAGGRLFPGVQSHARFTIAETDTRFRVEMDAHDTYALADVELSDTWASQLFPTVDAASEFYRNGAIGWSPKRNGQGAEPIELTSDAWAVQAGHVREIRSSFFEALPAGTSRLDSAVVMLDLPVIWEIPRAIAYVAPERVPA